MRILTTWAWSLTTPRLRRDIDFQKGTSDRIRYKRVNERTGKEVAYADIVKGHEVGDGQYLMVDADELNVVAPSRSRSLEIHTFVDLDDIDPMRPTGDSRGDRAR